MVQFIGCPRTTCALYGYNANGESTHENGFLVSKRFILTLTILNVQEDHLTLIEDRSNASIHDDPRQSTLELAGMMSRPQYDNYILWTKCERLRLLTDSLLFISSTTSTSSIPNCYRWRKIVHLRQRQEQKRKANARTKAGTHPGKLMSTMNCLHHCCHRQQLRRLDAAIRERRPGIYHRHNNITNGALLELDWKVLYRTTFDESV